MQDIIPVNLHERKSKGFQVNQATNGSKTISQTSHLYEYQLPQRVGAV